MCSPSICARKRGTVMVRRLPVLVGPAVQPAGLAHRRDDVDGRREQVQAFDLSAHSSPARRPPYAAR